MIINITDGSKQIKNLKALKPLLKKTVLKGLREFGAQKGTVNLIFVDAREIIRLNKQFIKKSHQTDVIAFNYNTGLPQTGSAPFGDIFVCADTAKTQSRELGHSFEKELLVLAAHGALHLSGLDDKTAAQKKYILNLGDKIVEEITNEQILMQK